MKSKVIIFVYDHFYPDFTAGGPVTAIANLIKLLEGWGDLRVLTSHFEYRSKGRLRDIIPNQWEVWKGVPVWYASGRAGIKKSLKTIPKNADVTVFLNGLFSMNYFIYVLWLAKRLDLKIIISPRGMLQGGAIKGGKVKKIIYLWTLKKAGLLNNVVWHATDNQERDDIQFRINKNVVPTVIPDIPVASPYVSIPVSKQKGQLRLIYFSLIAEKKNLLFLLKILDCQELSNINLDIIGPVKDQEYWRQCEDYLKDIVNPQRIAYKSEINPTQIPNTLPTYHALVLPTRGENFGHAIIEMLACQRPVLVSDKTPWNNIERYGAGYSLPLQDHVWKSTLIEMLNWDDDTFVKACSNSLAYYKQTFNFENLRNKYLELFNA